jgi:hypothetical protein
MNRFQIPPHTPEQAATAVLNACMHCFNNKQPWNDARDTLISLMQDMHAMGYNKAKEDLGKTTLPLPEVEVIENKSVDIQA